MSLSVASPALPARRSVIDERLVASALVLLLGIALTLAIAAPLAVLLSKSLQNAEGQFIGLANFAAYFRTPALVAALFNSLFVAILSTAIVIPLAFVFAYALTRSTIPGKPLFMGIALLPLFAPSLLPAIALIYIFGNQGFLKTLLFGGTIYGPIGIIIAMVFYTFPAALLIIYTALSLADGRLYEAAEAMGASRRRIFFTVTLPGARYGVISACFVVFTLVITDFGIPKVIGGSFSVLATDAYKQVIGQQNFEMGAVVGLILLVPAVLAFGVDRAIQRRQAPLLSARAVPYQPKAQPLRDTLLFVFCLVICALLLALVGVAVWASFITYWPYNLALTLRNYAFETFEASGWGSYWVSVKMAGLVALFGTALIFGGAYLIEKTKVAPFLRGFAHFLAMLPMAVPGLVLGIAYVFFINAKWNPLTIFYATMTVLVVNTIAHFYTVAHVTALTALKQIDSEFESVSASLQVPFWTTFRRVTAPISLPAVLDIAVYMFVNALTTVSALIFLYGPTNKPASVAIVHMDESGATAAAAAMATMLMLTAIGARIVQAFADHFLFGKLQKWRKR